VTDTPLGAPAQYPDVRDPPPIVRPTEKLSPAELSKLAYEILSEEARRDPGLAAIMRARGIPPDWDRRR
jgi:hypothetical protein